MTIRHKEQERIKGDGTAARVQRYARVYRATRDPKAAVRAYCAGNTWLEANARAVGNWR